VVECYFISESDNPKDSSTEMSVVARALDICQKILADRGIEMPEHLILEVGQFKLVVLVIVLFLDLCCP
jgi:Zn finger protein HypA/HybF involved in hydrogenase expression